MVKAITNFYFLQHSGNGVEPEVHLEVAATTKALADHIIEAVDPKAIELLQADTYEVLSEASVRN